MKHLLFLLISLSLFSCTKFGKTYRVKGKVINPITGEGFAGAEVSLSRNTIGIPGGSKVQKTVKTDENGNFDISKLAVRNDGVAVLGIANSEFDIYRIGWTKDGGKTFALGMGAKFGKTIHADYYAVPYGEMTLTINNINCLGPADSMQFCKKYQFDDTFESYSTYRLGCYYYNSEPFLVPIGSYIFKTKVTRNNLITYVYDTVLVSKSGIAHIQIDY